jgi:hypothetical protein
MSLKKICFPLLFSFPKITEFADDRDSDYLLSFTCPLPKDDLRGVQLGL